MWHKLNAMSKKLVIIATVLIITGVTIMGMSIWAYNTYIYNGQEVSKSENEGLEGEQQVEDTTGTNQVQEENKEPVLNHTIAIVAKDDTASLTDVILVVNFNSETNETHVISIPRDTYVVWSEEQKEYLKHEWRWTTTSKLTEMSSMGGIENIRETTLNYVESVIQEPIDNYIMIDTNAFVELIDAIGGVEVDVPQRMYYTDYSQGLYIDLQPGLQVLDGTQAEGFVRFRSTYQMGDLDRIEVQKIFMEAFAKKVTHPSIIMEIPQIIEVIFDSIKTDVKISEIGDYLPYLVTFDIEKLNFHTLPGESGSIEGRAVYIVDEEATNQLLTEIF